MGLDPSPGGAVRRHGPLSHPRGGLVLLGHDRRPFHLDIGEERATSPVLVHRDAEAFAAEHIADPAPIPRHYASMGRINLLGPPPLREPELTELDPVEVERRVAAGEAHVIDVRPVADYASGHIPGSLGVELDAEVGTWAGWLLAYDSPVVLVVGDDQDPAVAVADLGRVGFDHVVGIVRGVERWAAGGRPLRSFPTVDVTAFAEAAANGCPLLDVRSPAEWELGTVPGAARRHLPDLADGLPAELAALPPGSEVWIGCTSGQRAAVAAGLLEERGLRPVVLAEAGLFAVALDLRRRAAQASY